MYTEYTFQDFSVDKIIAIIDSYKGSDDFRNAREANAYFAGRNTEVMRKVILQSVVDETKDEYGGTKNQLKTAEVAGQRIASNYLFRFVTQENMYLLSNGVTLDTPELKEKLGYGFDTTLARMGEKAILHGVCYAYWNLDHVEIIPACEDANSGFVALLDETTGAVRAGIQFWQLSETRPTSIRLFEEDGITGYVISNGVLSITEPKHPYRLKVMTDALGSTVIGGGNYSTIPVIPLYANPDHRSEFTVPLKSKIDAYDRIFSDFGDNLDRANDIYWVLNNFGGGTDQILATINTINKIKAVANQSDGAAGATAHPETIEVPYSARQTALDLLEKAMYKDFMALDMNALTGGSLTNVAIEAAMIDLNLKCDRFEWECFDFVQKMLRLIGEETESIMFQRMSFVNRSEIVQDIYAMRSDIDIETALRLNPYIAQEDIPDIIKNKDAELESGIDSVDRLQEHLDNMEE